MCHGTNPKYLQFLNIIQEKKPTTKEIQKVFSLCFLEIQEPQQFFVHKINVEK
jgi:hypothetical protein